jgi:biofilm PGA synthesis N-glycosyltransferase PgaC
LEAYIQEALFVLFQLCFIVQLYYLLINHSRLAEHQPMQAMPAVNIPVSVIISARNEARNLTENLPYILQQNYPDFEVVVINDCSTDNSEDVLKDIQKEF